MIPAALLYDPAANDTLFEADTARVVETIATVPGKFGVRYFLHPLISEWLYPVTAAISLVTDGDMTDALHALTAMAAGAWIAGVYFLLRCVGCLRVDATLFALLGGTSAAAIVWFSVPEAHAWGSLSVIAALILAAVASRREVPVRWQVLVHVTTLSFTITNWLAALAASFVHLRWRRFVLVSVIAAAFAGGLALLEPVMRKASQRTVPLSSHTTVLLTAAVGVIIAFVLWRFARDGRLQRYASRAEALLSRRWMIGLVAIGALLAVAMATRVEAQFIGNSHRGSTLNAAAAFTFHAMVLPDFTEIDRYGRGWPTLSVQEVLPGDSGPVGLIATGAWGALLLAGGIALIRLQSLRRFRMAVAIALGGQFILHLIYGDETFLYALNWMPLLIVLAALATQTRLRPAVRVIAAIAIVLAAVNNIQQFDRAAERVTAIAAANAGGG